MKGFDFEVDVFNRRAVHPFPARMAANIPWEILYPCRRRLRVLDPMVGSGTSLIVGRAAGHSTFGVDSDPLAVLISKVGTADVDLSRIQRCAGRAVRSARRMEIAGEEAYPLNADEETRKFARYWFDLDARKQLAALSRAIDDLSDRGARKFLWCALSRTIITKEAGVSLARDVSHSRPHKSFARSPVKPLDAFEAAVKRVLKACLFRGNRSVPRASVWRGDARSLPLGSESIDLVITSPPYLNAIDYMRGHKLSLIWMGHQVNVLREIRSGSVGAECGDSGLGEEGIEQVFKSMGHVHVLPGRFQRMVLRYLSDMNSVMREISRVLAPKGRVVMVMGDCTLRGIYIRNSAAIRLLAAKHALKLTSERRRHIPDSRRYLPPPRVESGEALARRLRTEIVLSFRK